jgi:nicotinic acid mononucleotide adenylyltransferase
VAAPPSPPTLPPAEARRLRPLAAALARAGTAADGRPSLELVAGDLPAAGKPRVGLLAGTFNPFTRAHAALAVAGRRAGCDRVVLAMAPASLAKEGVERAHVLDRLAWTVAWARRHAWAAVAVAGSGLLVDMAEALGRAAGGAEVVLLLGADKAAELVEPRWYDDHDAAMARLGAAASALVAGRAGHEAPELPLASVGRLATPAWVPERSATEARALAEAGGSLKGLVPAPVAAVVARQRVYDADPAPYLARVAALNALLREQRENVGQR